MSDETMEIERLKKRVKALGQAFDTADDERKYWRKKAEAIRELLKPYEGKKEELAEVAELERLSQLLADQG